MKSFYTLVALCSISFLSTGCEQGKNSNLTGNGAKEDSKVVNKPTAFKREVFTKFKGIWDSANYGFAQAVTVSGPTKRIYLAGQASISEDTSAGIVVLDPTDKSKQLINSLENTSKILKELGSSMDDLVQCSFLVKDFDPVKDGAELGSITGRYLKANVATALIGVSGLAFPGMLVEVSCTAEVPIK
jgi:enamine deaminase RidA (YjgF/YER057c/UK114 family)